MSSSNDLDDKTRDELRDIARDRDLEVSGTKEELIERIEGDESATTDQLALGDAMRRGARQFRALTGLDPELVASANRENGAWVLRIQATEVKRVPTTSDIVGVWEVRLDSDGDVAGFQRVERGTRSAVGR